MVDDYVVVSDRDGAVLFLDKDLNSIEYKVENQGQHLATFKNQILGSGLVDGKIRYYNHETRISTMYQATSKVSQCDWHPSGEYFVSCHSDSSWCFWNVLLSDKEQFKMYGHHAQFGIKSIAIDKSGGALVGTGGGDGVLRVWDCRVGRCLLTSSEHVQAISSVLIRDGLFLTGGLDNKIVAVDLRKPNAPLYSIPAHTNCITGLDLLAGETVSVSLDGTLKSWHIGSGKLSGAYFVDEGSKLSGVCCVEQSDHTVYTCGFDRTVRKFALGDRHDEF
jgi:U4/U6 small nuclear ribonucleoprotein PRP4